MLTWAEPGGPKKGPRMGWWKAGVCFFMEVRGGDSVLRGFRVVFSYEWS